MKKCVVISCYIVNEYRRKLVQNLINQFNAVNIDVILASSDHIPKVEGVKNYITCKNNRQESILSDNLSAYFSTSWGSFNRKSKTSIYSNYFFRLYQMVSHYTKCIGYDYMYFIDQDMIPKDEYLTFISGEEIDTSKLHVYNFSDVGNKGDYQVTFFHGNIKILCELFSEENIQKAVNLAKTELITNVETSFAILANQRNDIKVISNKKPKDIFHKVNMFSSSNVADVYFDPKNKTYIFLQAKGDFNPDSIFSAELILNGEVIHKNTMSFPGVWETVILRPNTEYFIKYYDAEISPDTLSKTTRIYTDIENPIIENYLEVTV